MAKKTKDVELDEMLGGNDSKPADAVDLKADPWENETDTPLEEPSFSMDFSGTGDIKDGRYHFRVQEFTQETSKAGNPMFVVKVYLPQAGRSLTTNLSLVPAARWKAASALQAMGIKPAPDVSIVNFKRSDVIGAIGDLTIINVRGNEPVPEGEEPRMFPNVQNWFRPTPQTRAYFAELDG